MVAAALWAFVASKGLSGLSGGVYAVQGRPG